MAARYPALLPRRLAGTEQTGNTKHQGYERPELALLRRGTDTAALRTPLGSVSARGEQVHVLCPETWASHRRIQAPTGPGPAVHAHQTQCAFPTWKTVRLGE